MDTREGRPEDSLHRAGFARQEAPRQLPHREGVGGRRTPGRLGVARHRRIQVREAFAVVSRRHRFAGALAVLGVQHHQSREQCRPLGLVDRDEKLSIRGGTPPASQAVSKESQTSSPRSVSPGGLPRGVVPPPHGPSLTANSPVVRRLGPTAVRVGPDAGRPVMSFTRNRSSNPVPHRSLGIVGPARYRSLTRSAARASTTASFLSASSNASRPSGLLSDSRAARGLGLRRA